MRALCREAVDEGVGERAAVAVARRIILRLPALHVVQECGAAHAPGEVDAARLKGVAAAAGRSATLFVTASQLLVGGDRETVSCRLPSCFSTSAWPYIDASMLADHEWVSVWSTLAPAARSAGTSSNGQYSTISGTIAYGNTIVSRWHSRTDRDCTLGGAGGGAPRRRVVGAAAAAVG